MIFDHQKMKLDNCYPIGWSKEIFASISAVLSFTDSNSDPILLVLPPEVSPSSLAAVAAMRFLSNAAPAPKPHAKIALIPGRHFLRDLENTSFSLAQINAAFSKSRLISVHKQLSPVAQRVLKKIKTSPDENVCFHWIWRCDRVWDFYNTVKRDAVLPREYYGRGDPYDAVIDLIESDALARNSVKGTEYDLMIHTPFYHRVGLMDWNETFDQVVKSISAFKAKRKIIVVRSSYDFWARKIEEKIKISGYTCVVPKNRGTTTPPEIEIIVVNQCLDIEESRTLNKVIQMNWMQGNIQDKKIFHDLQKNLRKALISLSPLYQQEAVVLADEIEQAFRLMQLESVSNATQVIEKLVSWLRSSPSNAKTNRVFEEAGKHKIELWVTKESDRKDIGDESAKRHIEVDVKTTDRRMHFLSSSSGEAKKILSRVDRESDLDWVSYLGPGDAILMSSWEIVLRSYNIEKLWERSATWRENAERIGALSGDFAKNHDPVLSVTDQIIKLTRPPQKQTIEAPKQEIIVSEWWDEPINVHVDSNFTLRDAFKADPNGVPCIEVYFDDNLGMFLNIGTDVQVFRESYDGSEIISAEVSDLECGDVLILCKDEERGNILDIVMNHMSKTPVFGAHARLMQAWKDNLRASYHRDNETLESLIEKIENHGGKATRLTVRSWIFGSIMAPRESKNLIALIKALNIKINITELEAALIKLRGVPRAIGRMLTQLITEKDLDPSRKRDLEKVITEAGVDPDAIRAAVEIRTVRSISEHQILISSAQTKKIFKLN